MSDQEILLIYDRQCPLCHAYCRMLRIRKSVGQLRLIDARDPGAARDEITARGLDIDQGMVLKVGDTLYYGADAMHALALISGSSDMFNRLNYRVFRSKRLSRWLYPVLRSIRNIVLKLLGKTKINNLDLPGNSRF